MINKQPSYSSIVEWANKLKDYELDNVYFSVKEKPRVKLKSKSSIACSAINTNCSYNWNWNTAIEKYFSSLI